MIIKKISIIVPCYNEQQTLPKVYATLRVLDLGIEKEIIFVDDGSTDGSKEFLMQESESAPTGARFLFHDKNRGKGAAVRLGIQKATGDAVIVQDADYEYDPEDIRLLIDAAERFNASVVYGSRNLSKKNHYRYPLYYFGMRILTALINIFFRQTLTDPETCYKLIARDLAQSFVFRQNGFGIEIEITALLSQRAHIVEVPISYHPRSYSEGKKITVWDGVSALYLIFYYAFSRRTKK